MAGICGSDLRHWEKPDQHLRCCIMGHGLAGEVVEAGAEVTRIQPGDRVLIVSVLGCGRCDWCQVQQCNRCPDLYLTRRASVSRVYAEFVIGPQHKMQKLPDALGFDEGHGLFQEASTVCVPPALCRMPELGVGKRLP